MIKKGLSRFTLYFLYLISLLPFPVIYFLSDILYVLLYYIIHYRRDVVGVNLNNAFPEKTKEELAVIEKKYYKYLADLFFETIKMITLSEAQVKARFRITNPELTQNYLDNGQSLLAAVGHYCNWEWACLAQSLATPKRKVVIYKPLSNTYFDEKFKQVRSRFGATLVPMKQTLRKIVEYRNEPTISLFANDQTPVREETQYWTTFLNQPTAIFLGIEKIAKQTNRPVIYGHTRRVKRGYYEVDYVMLVEDPSKAAEYEITEKHTRYLEQMINTQPEFWLWSHRRWKFKPKDN